MEYTIGEAAAYLNTTPSALRFYEKEGLLPFVKRSRSGKRVFTEADFEWLLIIGCLKKTGLPLKKIREFVNLTQKEIKQLASENIFFTNSGRRLKNKLPNWKQTARFWITNAGFTKRQKKPVQPMHCFS